MPFVSTSADESQYSDSPWYAIYTRHQHEKMVDQVLTSKGFNTFLPLYVATHNWKDRTKKLSLPLFPCMTAEEQEFVVETVSSTCAAYRA